MHSQFSKGLAGSDPLSAVNIDRLSSQCRVSLDALMLCLGNPACVPQPGLLLGALELGDLAERAVTRGYISALGALSMMDKVCALFDQLEPGYIQMWMAGRHRSECALANNFAEVKRCVGDIYPERTQEIKERFERVIREKTGISDFDISADALRNECNQPIIPFLRKALDNELLGALNWPEVK